jgi:hypothetical protein
MYFDGFLAEGAQFLIFESGIVRRNLLPLQLLTLSLKISVIYVKMGSGFKFQELREIIST